MKMTEPRRRALMVLLYAECSGRTVRYSNVTTDPTRMHRPGVLTIYHLVADHLQQADLIEIQRGAGVSTRIALTDAGRVLAEAQHA